MATGPGTDNTQSNIVILGGTGRTGLQLIEQALKRGYHVIAPVRNVKKLEHIKNQNLEVVQCDLMNSDDLSKHLKGCNVVLSALGYSGFPIGRISFYEESIKSITKSMRNTNIKRLICITSMYSKYQPQYPLFVRFLIRPMISGVLNSMFDMEQYLEKECPDLDYTIVRPPTLTNDSLITDKEVKVCENDYHFPDQSTTMRISRANLACFMLDISRDQKYIRQGIAVDMPKT